MWKYPHLAGFMSFYPLLRGLKILQIHRVHNMLAQNHQNMPSNTFRTEYKTISWFTPKFDCIFPDFFRKNPNFSDFPLSLGHYPTVIRIFHQPGSGPGSAYFGQDQDQPGPWAGVRYPKNLPFYQFSPNFASRLRYTKKGPPQGGNFEK